MIGIYTDSAAERIYQTVWYQCGHPMLRAIFRQHMNLREVADTPREVFNSWQDCRHCRLRQYRYEERQREKRESA